MAGPQVQRVLVATDGSEAAGRAVSLAAAVARTFSATLIIATVGNDATVAEIAQSGGRGEPIGDILHWRARRILESAADSARQAGTSNLVLKTAWGDVAEAILGIAEREHSDLIVIGRRGLGKLTRLLLGSVSQKLASLATCPVTVVP